MTAVAYLLGAFLAAATVYASYRRWRQATMAALYLLVFEGALRKWVFPTAQEYLYFAKDLVLLGVYLRLLQEGRLTSRAFGRALGRAGFALLVVGTLWTVAQIANPDGAGFWVGLFGLKAYVFAIPLLVVVPHAFPDRRSLLGFLWSFAALAIPTGLLAVVQFFSSPDALVNRYAWGGSAPTVATFAEARRVRVTSTFSYISGYASYLSVMAPLFVGLLGLHATRRRLLILVGGFGLITINLFMTGSRSPTLVAAAACLVTASTLSWLRSRRSITLALRLAMGAAVSYLLATAVLPTAFEAFLDRVRTTTEDVDVRTSQYFLAFIPLADWGDLPVFWLGHGTGSAHQGAQHLSERAARMLPEGEFPRIGWELGPVGYLLWWLFRAALVIRVLLAARQLRDPELRPLGHAAAAVMVFNFPGGYVYNPTMQMLVYFLAALPELLRRFEREGHPAHSAPPVPVSLVPAMRSA